MAPRPIGTPIADEMTRAGRISPPTPDRNEQQRADASAASETIPGTIPEEEILLAGVPDRPRSIIDQVHETAATTPVPIPIPIPRTTHTNPPTVTATDTTAETTTAARRTGMFSLPMFSTPWTRRESEPDPSYIPKLSMARFTPKVESHVVFAWPILITIITLQLAGTILVAISLNSGEVGTATKIIVGVGACLVLLLGVIPVHMKPKRAQHVVTLIDAFLRLSLVRIWLFSTLFCLAVGVRVYTDWILGCAFDDVGGVGLHGGKGVLMWCYFCLSKGLLLAF
ncbi:hypothetical protein QBC46DRAFT_391884 [Diplogelasinospora grovesii]|uniref:Uncharacterized protein n=1 Tax=Diplogelasinospora grovesii TaxID=303347 RepID=A0AAN6S2M9_9PEZI|nr:hypothetical protein QBC46DRAFT_391884 [Diplogelasinospora grovesii]